jgi:hypothetical protein
VGGGQIIFFPVIARRFRDVFVERANSTHGGIVLWLDPHLGGTAILCQHVVARGSHQQQMPNLGIHPNGIPCTAKGPNEWASDVQQTCVSARGLFFRDKS